MFNSMFTVVYTDKTRKFITIKQYETKEAYINEMTLMHSRWGTVNEATKECRILAEKHKCKFLWEGV